MELLTRTFTFLLSLNKDDDIESRVRVKLLEVLSLLCGIVIPDPLGAELPNEEGMFIKDWTSFPIKAGWQNLSHELISKRFYNLAIGCVVSNFSGWEMDEFNLDLLRASNEKRHFGVNIGGERVSGYISPSTEAELVDQWKQIVELLPQFSNFDFKSNLDAAKTSSWYKEVVEEMGENGDSMEAYGEKDAFALFLTLSRLCLKAASSTASDAGKHYALIKLALSVVLPLVSTLPAVGVV